MANLQYDSREMELRAISQRVNALHNLGRNDEAEDLGIRTLNVWRDANEEEGKKLLWTIREIRAERSTEAKHYTLRLHAPGVYVGVDAVADSPEEALAFARELEPEDLAINHVKTIGPKPDEPKGIYFVSGRVYYKE
jgi:hypothetical protein